MSITAPWLRLASDFADSPMFDTIDSPGPLLAWVGLLCEAKERGRGGRFTLRRAAFCRRYRVTPGDVEECLRSCAGALRIAGDVIEVVNWKRYQDSNVLRKAKNEGQDGDSCVLEQKTLNTPTHHTSHITHHTSQEQEIPIARSRAKPRSEQQAGVWGAGAIRLDTNARAWTGITDDDLRTWAQAYPAVEIPVAIAQALAWCLANPTNGRKSNYTKFLNGWLKRAQDSGGSRGPAAAGAADPGAAKRAAILDEIKRRDAAKAGGEW